MKRISILGCGQTGLVLGRELAAAGYPVYGSTTREQRFPELEAAGISPVKLALGQHPEDDLNPFVQTDVLVIMLPPSQVGYPELLRRISTSAIAAGVEQIIFTGTTFIYPLANRSVTETDIVPEQTSSMGVNWLEAEQAVTEPASGRATVVRLAGLIGPGHNAAKYFSGRPMAGAENPVNMVHSDDVAGIIHALIAGNIQGETFNVAAPEHPTRRQFYTLASQTAGIAPPQFTDEARPYRLVNCDHLHARLGYQFRYPDPLQAL